MDGRGEVLTFGGQVMKNVAGYDVSRLMAGSLGTLGIILEVSLKVLPLPVAEATLGFELPEDRGDRRSSTAGAASRCRSARARVERRYAARAPLRRRGGGRGGGDEARRRARRGRRRRGGSGTGLREHDRSLLHATTRRCGGSRCPRPRRRSGSRASS